MQQAKYLAVDVFQEGITPEEQQKVQSVTPSDSTNTQSDTKTNTTAQEVKTEGSNNQTTGLPAYVPWIGAGVVAIVILIALLTIIRNLNNKNRH